MSQIDNRDLIIALDELEKEKEINKDVILEAIENSLLAACKNHFGKADNIKVNIDRETGEVNVYAEKEVVDEVLDDVVQIDIDEARKEFGEEIMQGDMVNIVVTPKDFGRIAESKTGRCTEDTRGRKKGNI